VQLLMYLNPPQPEFEVASRDKALALKPDAGLELARMGRMLRMLRRPMQLLQRQHQELREDPAAAVVAISKAPPSPRLKKVRTRWHKRHRKHPILRASERISLTTH
jgi:hypothetical protein